MSLESTLQHAVLPRDRRQALQQLALRTHDCNQGLCSILKRGDYKDPEMLTLILQAISMLECEFTEPQLLLSCIPYADLQQKQSILDLLSKFKLVYNETLINMLDDPEEVIRNRVLGILEVYCRTVSELHNLIPKVNGFKLIFQSELTETSLLLLIHLLRNNPQNQKLFLEYIPLVSKLEKSSLTYELLRILLSPLSYNLKNTQILCWGCCDEINKESLMVIGDTMRNNPTNQGLFANQVEFLMMAVYNDVDLELRNGYLHCIQCYLDQNLESKMFLAAISMNPPPNLNTVDFLLLSPMVQFTIDEYSQWFSSMILCHLCIDLEIKQYLTETYLKRMDSSLIQSLASSLCLMQKSKMPPRSLISILCLIFCWIYNDEKAVEDLLFDDSMIVLILINQLKVVSNQIIHGLCALCLLTIYVFCTENEHCISKKELFDLMEAVDFEIIIIKICYLKRYSDFFCEFVGPVVLQNLQNLLMKYNKNV